MSNFDRDIMNRAGNAAASLGRSVEAGVERGQDYGSSTDQDTTADANREVFTQWLKSNRDNNYGGVPDDDLCSAWNNWCQGGAKAEQIEQATASAVRSMPREERQGFVQQMLSLFQSNGVDPRSLGVHTTDPSQVSPDEVGRMVGYAQQERPDLMQQLFGPNGLMSNPMVKMALTGILAYAANQFLGGRGAQQGGYPSQGGYGYPNQGQGSPQTGIPGLGGGGFDIQSLIGMFTGGRR